MTPESSVKAAIKKVLTSFAPVWHVMPAANGYGKMGVPDFLVCANGKFFAIEAKSDEGELTALQALQLTGILNASGFALTITGLDEVPLVIAHLHMMGCYRIEQRLRK